MQINWIVAFKETGSDTEGASRRFSGIPACIKKSCGCSRRMGSLNRSGPRCMQMLGRSYRQLRAYLELIGIIPLLEEA